jgi:hypothetical protein
MSNSDTKKQTEMTWQEKQGSILTGSSQLVRLSAQFKDFLPSDLPHHLLTSRSTRSTFRRWLSLNRRSTQLIGCWSRPVFAGGFLESTDHDTAAFNLQSPSFFIDMRFPHSRSNLLSKRRFADFTNDELIQLSQQHCFGGYTLPELSRYSTSVVPSPAPVYTRHHIVDWNYHPSFPRNRPNRWFVQFHKDPEGKDSFKEYSVIRDEDGVPVYYERWERIAPFPQQTVKYLVLRKSLPCPMELAKQSREPETHERRDGLLIVIGQHFAFVLDRDYPRVLQHAKDCAEDLRRGGKGGGGFFVSFLLSCPAQRTLTPALARSLAEEYLSLEGDYGRLVNSSAGTDWSIEKSTFPWQEGGTLFQQGADYLLPEHSGESFTRLRWTTPTAGSTPERTARARGDWEVLENSFSVEEIFSLFRRFLPVGTRAAPNSRL